MYNLTERIINFFGTPFGYTVYRQGDIMLEIHRGNQAVAKREGDPGYAQDFRRVTVTNPITGKRTQIVA